MLKLLDAPLATVAITQSVDPVVPAESGVQMNVGPLVCVSETNVVFVGSASENESDVASLGPLFVMVTTYVRFVSMVTGSGESLAVIATSAAALTVVDSVSELSGA